VAGVYQATIMAIDGGSGLTTSQTLSVTVRSSSAPAPQPAPPTPTPTPAPAPPAQPSALQDWWQWIKGKVTGWF
jgi:hypothetical protein